MEQNTEHFLNENNCLNSKISYYFETSGGQNSNPHLNVPVHFFYAIENVTFMAA